MKGSSIVINGRNYPEQNNDKNLSGTVVNVNDKDLSYFDVLNVNINKPSNGTESKKIVIVNIDNLKLTVDTTKGGIWVFLKSQKVGNNYPVNSMAPRYSSEKTVSLSDKDLSYFDILNITINSEANNPQSRKKINVFINDKVIILDTRNYVSLSMKNSEDIGNNNNNVFYTYNSNGNNVDVKYHFGSGNNVYYSIDGESGNFDKEAFDRGMNQLRESMERMKENLQRSFSRNWMWN